MVNFMLMITAELENLTNLQPQGGCNDDNFPYHFKLEMCFQTLGALEILAVPIVPWPLSIFRLNCPAPKLKCGNCGEITQKETYVSLGETVPLPIGKGHTHLIQKLEGTKFEGIDLSGDEFAEYDEKGECPVMISNPRATFNSRMTLSSNTLLVTLYHTT
ncbi:hypothetical protein RND71_020684 [Anisodus tanguticus]|uniref:Uncharacterized protein n=1 Tax=Anisodus tanguticus TaxID=243964 RepID=A0AAE1RVL1_9SOLA|nr:hypothetical protein RND71_020684 [Anisodus tanguticus]